MYEWSENRQKLHSLGYIFVADSIWVALQIFEQFCPKAEDANPLVAKPETDFNAKWPFKVIYFNIIEEPLMGYVVQYIVNVALDVKVRKI